MKKAIFAVVMLISGNVIAEDSVAIKSGYQHTFCDGLSDSPRIEVSYEHKFGNDFALEAGTAAFFATAWDTQRDNPKPEKGDRMGYLVPNDFFVTGKKYFGDFYVGVGADFYLNNFIENDDIYPDEVKADIDNEFGGHAVIGWTKDSWFVEGKYSYADFSAESNIKDTGICEAHSRLNNVAVMVGRRWKF